MQQQKKKKKTSDREDSGEQWPAASNEVYLLKRQEKQRGRRFAKAQKRTGVAQSETLAVDDVDNGRAEAHARFHDAVEVLMQADGLDERRQEHADCNDIAVPHGLLLVLCVWRSDTE